MYTVYQRDQRKAFITLDHLYGEADFKKSQDQVDTIPTEVLEDLREAALATLFRMPVPGMPSAGYSSIRQEPGENFCEFIEMLRAAVERRVKNEVAQREVLTSIAQTNANKRCHRKIEALPLDPEPTLEQMVEVSMELAPDPVPSDTLPQKKTSSKTVVSIGTVQQSQAQNPPSKCFNCGDSTHFAKQCPKPPKKTVNPPGSKCLTGPEGHCSCLLLHQQVGYGQ